MYNSRGWAYDLFTDEDIVLLNEKIDELNQGNLSTDYKLNDESQLIELNNKMIVFYGNRSEPIKEVVYNEFADYRIDKTSCTAFLNYVQEVTGNEYDGIYISDSFQFTKGSAGERTRAILPDDFSNYGYTKQFQDRTGNHTETTPEFSKREIKTNKGYTLSDNSRIIEINNKIVLLGGKYDNPVIYHVFVINATSENDVRPVKEFLYDVITERKVGNRIHYCEVVESISSAVIKVQGRGAVRSFEKSDYEYNRGSSAWQRATLPSYFNHFGYTTKHQDRTGNNTEATQEVSKRIDTDYLSAVERGDMETAQRMADKAQLKKAAAGNACDSFCNYSAILISTGNQINLLR